MHLIEMELYGFKSFAKRTRIRFSKDITAIVGPNGSGKSNIVDGIMWALGESSVKQLRGNKMEDVIFSGTDRHQGVNFAEVVLTFDNKDGFFDLPYEELSVSRKYFRSGESQYTINKKRVRQKDVREIFLDTGIGKNGYSFIGQGQIEEILSTRPQDRRNAFEEAAGISKFKLRKEETLRNLNKTTEHIERIDDIFSELKSRAGEMEEKREKALRLKELTASKEKYSFALLTKEVEAARLKQSKIAERYDAVEMDWKGKKETNRLAEERILGEENEIESFGEKEAALNDEIMALIQKKEQSFGDVRSKKERRTRLHLEKEQLERAMGDLKKEVKELQSVSKTQKDFVDGLKRRVDEKTTELERLTTDFHAFKEEVESLDMDEKSRRKVLEQMTDRRHSLESRVQALGYLLKERKERLEQLNARKTALRRENGGLSEHVADREAREAELNREIKDLTEGLNRSKEQIVQEKKKKETLEQEIKSLAARADEIEREKRYLERLRDNHEGFQYGVKQFLKEAQSEAFYDSVIGPVAEHFHVAREDALAMSTALGYSGQNIILRDDREIRTILSYLKSRKMGRLTFLPINNLSHRALPDDFGKKTNVVYRVASDCVQCDENLRTVAEFLLGRILLVETVDEGKKLAKDLNHRFRIVTRGGDVFQVGGAVTGGTAKNQSTELYTRDEEIAKKGRELKEMESRLHQAEETLAEREKEFSAFLAVEREQIEALALKENKQRTESEQLYRLRSALEQAGKQLSSLEEEIQKETEAVGRDSEEKMALESAVQDVMRSEKTLGMNNKDDVSRVHRDLEERREALHAAKLEKQQIAAGYREESLRLEQELRDLEGKKSRVSASAENVEVIVREIAELDEALSLEEPESVVLEERVTELQEAFVSMKNHVAERKQRLREEKAVLEENKEQAFTLEKELVRLQNQLEEADRACIIFSDALEQMENPGDVQELLNMAVTVLRKKEAAIEGEIASIGPVDGDALIQYDAWKERVDFLSGQREDLVLSKEKLEKMIRHFDRDMRKQLEEALILINGYFNDIFRELFQGGKASLAWDEGDILETGILISAQPPGKKLQSLSLLSGGERSMTAVALLFALLRMRQSPFCIVDEIDAALDDANIRRYSNYVKQIEDMQFIMITHRKQTMEMANEIYGVTMEEKGISRLLFLELEEVEAHAGVVQTKNQ
ncbi:MAG: chromosome segregation protein SMC [Peptoniphilus sp.]|nr:chromosome segregation protein SMC [Peptoniphilus sp.]MDY3119212.1 chromosome segregation protein SMC [Peptoniphilus sp.]